MVRADPDTLVALGSEWTLQACVRASRILPIVFVANNYDPIALGYVQGLANPGGNVTGVFLRQTELAEKQVELLTEAVPDRTRLAILWDSISADQFVAAERRAKLLGLRSCRARWKLPLMTSRQHFGASPMPPQTCSCFCPARFLLLGQLRSNECLVQGRRLPSSAQNWRKVCDVSQVCG